MIEHSGAPSVGIFAEGRLFGSTKHEAIVIRQVRSAHFVSSYFNHGLISLLVWQPGAIHTAPFEEYKSYLRASFLVAIQKRLALRKMVGISRATSNMSPWP